MSIDQQIKQELKKILKDKIAKNSQKIVITSSHELNKSDMALVMSRLSGLSKNQEVEYRVDEGLLGGVVVRIGSKLVDLSLSGRLANLKFELYENT